LPPAASAGKNLFNPVIGIQINREIVRASDFDCQTKNDKTKDDNIGVSYIAISFIAGVYRLLWEFL
jgi:hypothetical protein